MKSRCHTQILIFALSILMGLVALSFFTSLVLTGGGEQKQEILGVIDRFENDQAVILIEELELEIILPKAHLPPQTKENMLVPVTPRILWKTEQ